MKKKYYISFVLVGALLIFISLPIINYNIDQWRVLHHDYETSYRGISPNKSFLKTAYLLDNKEKYDTILMGSSRSGYMDAGLISENAYNMKFNFALAAMHLHNLKLLLANNVKIKKLWLGVNDYVIWKDPKDHESDFQRRTFKNNFYDQLDTYSFYLLKGLNGRDIKILEGKYPLMRSEELTKPDKINMETARAREKYALEHPTFWIDKMTTIKPTLLGYKDDKYRIDKAISEIEAIKKICEKNDIELTVFMYPIYYKTYLSFNQYKIEEFKKKLASVVDFYDFYELNEISLDEFKWQDSSHFHASIGDYIIKSIQENKFLVHQDNINDRITETRKLITNVIHKPLPIKYLYKFNPHIDTSSLKRVFDLSKEENGIAKKNQLSLQWYEDHIKLDAQSIDPFFILNPVKASSENVILKCKIESSQETMFQLYYKKTDRSIYNEADAYRVTLHKGSNEFNILIPAVYLKNNLRVDIVDKIGIYKIEDFTVYGL